MSHSSKKTIKPLGIFSRGIARLPLLHVLLGRGLLRCSLWTKPQRLAGVLGWGQRPSTRRARAYAQQHGLPYVALEDGLLRSFGTGEHFPPLAMVQDDIGIYYDCTRPSALERRLASDANVLLPDLATVQRLRRRLLDAGLSKYNHAPDVPIQLLRADDQQRILVVDQTAGDMSVTLGGASAASFQAMLQAALAENPSATIYVKTHPEVAAGRKGGYLTAVQSTARVVVLREAVNPLSLLRQMDKVYVVSSTMGFEALLAGKPVTCFGVPWYAGWGVTDDRQPDHPAILRRADGKAARQGRKRTVDELFAVAYMQYTRYLNPETHKRGEMSDVMRWLQLQRTMAQRFAGRMICVGFPRWRAWNFRDMLSLYPGRVQHVGHAKAAAALEPSGDDCLVCWGRVPPSGVEKLAQQCGVRLLRMEDGFVRSVGLGSDLIPPRSFVLDAKGIYFDPGQPSELEDLLNQHTCSPQDVQRAQAVRKTIVKYRLTKYNLEQNAPVQWSNRGRMVVLVPGQVEDDASILFGCDVLQGVHTNLGLLKAARTQFPDAFIVYKPHPDVVSGNRKGRLSSKQAMQYADEVEVHASVVSCVEACEVVVTMTSLTGFDALLRGKRVVVHGRPFYAGWGVTEDLLTIPRRLRHRSIDELVFCTLIAYPLYWDPILKGYTTCEAVLEQLRQERDALTENGKLQRLRVGYLARQWRKLQVLWQAYC